MKTLYILLLILVSLSLSCTKEDVSADAASGGGAVGKGGSLARMVVVKDHMFILAESDLKCVNIADPANPSYLYTIALDPGMETLFSKDTLLFIGSQRGVYIYNIKNPSAPERLSIFDHILSCDPVVADDNFAYVTLRTGTNCNRGINQLQIIDLANIRNPVLVKAYDMTNPGGLGLDNKTLFVCDDGLKVYDISDVHNIRKTAHFTIGAIDVIPHNGLLLVMGSDGFYQYEYQNQQISLLSTIPVIPNR